MATREAKQYKALYFDLVDDMTDEMPWFWECVNHFEVTNIGRNYDLMQRKPVDDVIEIID